MFQPLNPDFEKHITDRFTRQPFIVLLGLELEKAEPGQITCLLRVGEQHKQNKGYVHGGALATIADVATGFAAATLVAQGQHIVTVELKISYLNPALSAELRAVGRVLKAGRKLHFCEAEIFAVNEGKQQLVAKATATMAVLNENEIKTKQA